MHQTPSQTELEAFLDEALPPERMAQIEQALRDDPHMNKQLATAVGRRDAGVHSLGGVWRRHRLTCPTREQLGSYLLGVLDEGQVEYVGFHLKKIGCRLCQASLADLQAQQTAAEATQALDRRRKYFQTSAGMLGAE